MIVTDCSVIVAALMSDEQETYADHVLTLLRDGEEELVLPSVFYLEVSNALLYAFQRGRMSKAAYDDHLKFIVALNPIIDEHALTPEGMYDILRLAEAHSLTTYDASYLELALRYGAKLATLDQRLIAAAKASNVYFESS